MSENDDAIERLTKKLYSANNEEVPHVKRTQFFRTGDIAPTAWRPEEKPEVMKPPPRIRIPELLFLGSAVFFVIALGISAFLFFGGANTVSTRNVQVEVIGPTQVSAGSTLSLQVIITNRNAVPMELTDLVVEFPPGTRSDRDVTVELPRIRDPLGRIEPGESVNRTIRAVPFGIQGADFSAKLSAEYRVPSSNAVLVSETVYSARISDSPAAISVNSLAEAVSGQPVTINVTITSNATEVLSDMLLVATYPPGFTLESSSPNPTPGGNAWALGDIEPLGTRVVTIRGTFSGEDGENRVIHFTTGNRKTGEESAVAAPLAVSDMIIAITKPFISVELALEEDTAEVHAIQRGNEVEGTVTWTNNLPNRVQNVSIVLKFEGAVLDRSSVSSQTGFYNSGANTLEWNRTTNPLFADVAPGTSGTERFSFATLPTSQGAYRNAEIKLSASVSANRFSELNVPETVESRSSILATVLTNLGLEASLVYGPGDTGPLPPKADNATTYTVTWRVTNTGNAVANANVTGTLPSYVAYLGGIGAGSEAVSFNDTGRVVTWNLGDVNAGQSKSVSYRVSVTPSLSHVGTQPLVIGEQEASGLDRYVRYNVKQSAPDLTTQNAASSPGGGNVVP